MTKELVLKYNISKEYRDILNLGITLLYSFFTIIKFIEIKEITKIIL